MRLSFQTLPSHHQDSELVAHRSIVCIPLNRGGGASTQRRLTPEKKQRNSSLGFTVRSVRVYLSETSDRYTIEHIVAAVHVGSPADLAGLRENDLITHVHTQPIHNMTHPQLMNIL